jgi:hypothetical protein
MEKLHQSGGIGRRDFAKALFPNHPPRHPPSPPIFSRQGGALVHFLFLFPQTVNDFMKKFLGTKPGVYEIIVPC